MSAPKTMSGRSRRASAQNATAWARECRRFIRFRIMSSPAWSDRCRCGISRSSSASARISGSSASIVSMEDSRSRGSSGTSLRILRVSRAERHLAGQVRAIGGDVDAGQHDLAIAALGERAHLIDDDAGRNRSRIAAAIGNDTEGAAVVAAVLDLDIGAGARSEARDQMMRGLANRHDVVHRDTLGRAIGKSGECRRTHLLVIADDVVDLVHRGERVRIGLRGAAGYDDARVGVFPAGLAHGLARLTYGLGGYRAAIDDDGVFQPCRPRMLRHRLAFVGVETAAEIDDLRLTHRSFGLIQLASAGTPISNTSS